MSFKVVTRASVSIANLFGSNHIKNSRNAVQTDSLNMKKKIKKVEVTKKPFTNNIIGIEGSVMALEQLGVIK